MCAFLQSIVRSLINSPIGKHTSHRNASHAYSLLEEFKLNYKYFTCRCIPYVAQVISHMCSSLQLIVRSLMNSIIGKHTSHRNASHAYSLLGEFKLNYKYFTCRCIPYVAQVISHMCSSLQLIVRSLMNSIIGKHTSQRNAWHTHSLLGKLKIKQIF